MRIKDLLPEIRQLNAQVVAISADSEWSHKAFAEKLGVDFPLLADWFGNVGNLYRVWSDEKQREMRTVFIIDSAGVVAYQKSYGDDEAPDFGPALEVLRRLSELEERMSG